nr:DUF2931 family protein [uncultured Capnocytophaga sp.]
MIKTIIIITFILIALWLTGCWGYKAKQDKNNKANANVEPKYKWGIAVNAPIGYPIRFYAGRVGGMSITGELYSKTREPDWGNAMGYESRSMEELPQNVDMVWLSYKEDCFYRLKTAIDYEKVAKLFREGFDERVPNGEVRHKTYDTIVVGIAPGGVVVLWVGYGYLPLTEIGRYQAEKIALREPEGLDNHQKLIFSKKDREEVLNSNTIIPEDFREANKNKPIPFGLWDSYRDTQYQWYPTFEVPEGKMGDVGYRYWNGEAGTTLYTDFNSYMGKQDIFYLEESIQKRPLFKNLLFYYKTQNGQKYLAELSFDWEAVVAAYKKVFGEDADKVTAHLDIRINRENTYLTVRLVGDNGKEAFIEPKLIDIGEANQEYAPPFDN